MTNENKSTLQHEAMLYGTFMGIFWTLKFVLFPLGMKQPMLLLAFFLLTFIGVPVLGYRFARQYRDRCCTGTVNFHRVFVFTALMYIFAALFATVAHYIYFRYLDNGLIIATYQDMLTQMMEVADSTETEMSLGQMQQALDTISNLTPLEISIQLITQNVFYCTLLALPTALLVRRNTSKVQP